MRFNAISRLVGILWLAGLRLWGGELPVYFPDQPEKELTIRTVEVGPYIYLSTKGLAQTLSANIFINPERGKMVVYVDGHRVKVSGQSSFVMIDNRVFQMPIHALSDAQDIYLPMRPFFYILRHHLVPGISYDETAGVIRLEMATFNIRDLTIDEKANGTVIHIRTTRRFDDQDLEAWLAQNGWFYLTVVGGVADSLALSRTLPTGMIRTVTADQTGNMAQLAFHLRSQIENHELYQNSDPPEIVLTLRTPLSYSAEKIRRLRDSWYIDTIVLDPGHGGKDSGTVGKYGLSEKFVTLDIGKRLGRLLESNANVEVVYTRTEDVFIPLWQRSKMANESNGKLFISIHANANRNRRIRGFETYILSPGRTADAVDVAERENAVIKLEEEVSRYDHLTEDNFIVASLVQNAFMKESEDLASMIQQELRKRIPSPDRGVKQAGFYVLIGGSMPNVLIEVGFLSNPQEEKQLRKPGYREGIAQSIFEGIRRFKYKYERVLDLEAQG
ncbi:MAG: N-acetylmuramoyl-L-alanine amidase [Fidelibacterota bacterium]